MQLLVRSLNAQSYYDLGRIPLRATGHNSHSQAHLLTIVSSPVGTSFGFSKHSIALSLVPSYTETPGRRYTRPSHPDILLHDKSKVRRRGAPPRRVARSCAHGGFTRVARFIESSYLQRFISRRLRNIPYPTWRRIAARHRHRSTDICE